MLIGTYGDTNVYGLTNLLLGHDFLRGDEPEAEAYGCFQSGAYPKRGRRSDSVYEDPADERSNEEHEDGRQAVVPRGYPGMIATYAKRFGMTPQLA